MQGYSLKNSNLKKNFRDSFVVKAYIIWLNIVIKNMRKKYVKKNQKTDKMQKKVHKGIYSAYFTIEEKPKWII